jgi:hypothetical protein
MRDFTEESYAAFEEAAIEKYDFSTCQRPDGSKYGSPGRCIKGSETSPASKDDKKSGSSKSASGGGGGSASSGGGDAVSKSKTGQRHAAVSKAYDESKKQQNADLERDKKRAMDQSKKIKDPDPKKQKHMQEQEYRRLASRASMEHAHYGKNRKDREHPVSGRLVSHNDLRDEKLKLEDKMDQMRAKRKKK